MPLLVFGYAFQRPGKVGAGLVVLGCEKDSGEFPCDRYGLGKFRGNVNGAVQCVRAAAEKDLVSEVERYGGGFSALAENVIEGLREL
jgi:hypothetical protein